MKLHDLYYLPPVTLAASHTVYRVQRIKARPGAASIGPLKMAPIGDMSGRFALAMTETGYFAESPETWRKPHERQRTGYWGRRQE